MSDNETRSPQDRRRQAVADTIIAAARSIVLDRTTVDALSMREVARRADYTVGALYRYFPSRRALLGALFADAGRLMTSYFEPALELPASARLMAFADAYLAFGREHPEDLVLLFQTAAQVPTWNEYVQIASPFTLAVQAVAEGAAIGTVRLPAGLDAADTAYGFWTLLHGMAELQRTHLRDVKRDPQRDVDYVQHAILDHFVASITPSAAPAASPTSHEQKEPS